MAVIFVTLGSLARKAKHCWTKRNCKILYVFNKGSNLY